MIRSSLGFHTMTLSLFLNHQEILQLHRDFIKYWRNTEKIQMYRFNENGTLINHTPKGNNTSLLPLYLIIYYKEYSGITWSIRSNTQNESFKSYIVDATINPKFLSGISDYLTAATYNDMPTAITNFNNEIKKISPILKDFDYYKITRIDYCINFWLDELAVGCSSDRMMDLIKRSNIPRAFTEWTKYDEIAHRKISKPNSF